MSWAPIGIFLIMAIASLKLASVLALPIVIAVLLTLLLRSPLAWLGKRRIPEPVGAGILVFGSTIAFLTCIWFLAEPAAEWMAQAPRSLTRVERKLRRLSAPLDAIQQTAAKVDEVTSPGTRKDAPVVQVARPALMERISSGGVGLVGSAVSVIFLSYFLLAATPLFRRKLAMVLPGSADRREVEEVLRQIEGHMSRYLWLSTVINLAVGLMVWGLLEILEYPNAALWGAAAAILNYVPYLGAVVTAVAIGFVGLVSFPAFTPVVWGVLGFAIINLLESNLITPALMGRKLPVNAAALFLGLLFFGWMWGIVGAVLAVPLTVMVQVISARIPATQSLSVFLDS